MNIYRNKQNRWHNIYYDGCYPSDGEQVLICRDDELEEYEVVTYYAVDPKCDIEWAGSGFYKYKYNEKEDWQEKIGALAWMHINPYKETTHCFEDCDDYLGVCKNCIVDFNYCPYNGQAVVPKIEDPVEYYAAMLDFAKKQRDDGVWFIHEE